MEWVFGHLSGIEEVFGAGHNVLVNITIVVVVINFVEEKEIVHFVIK